MKILLTGATGFLGSHLLSGLVQRTKNEIIILKRSFSNAERIASLINNSRVRYYDIDRCELNEVFRNNQVDIIIHCATEYGRGHQSLQKILETNIAFPVMLIEYAIKNGVSTFINTDTYFNKNDIGYSSLLNYSLSKKNLITWLNKFSSKLKIINARLEHIYGEYDSTEKFVEMLFREIALNKSPRVSLTHGNQKRDFIYIDDVVSAYLKLVDYSKDCLFSFSEFEVGTGCAHEVKKVAKIIKQLSSSHTILGFGDIEYRDDEIMHSKADIKPMLNLGWEPKVKLLDGLRRIYQKYQTH